MMMKPLKRKESITLIKLNHKKKGRVLTQKVDREETVL